MPGTISVMFNRIPFWLGLCLGGAATFASHCFRRSAPKPTTPDPLPDPLFSLAGDAVIICDAAGAIVSANATAQEWFGAGLTQLSLCYPTGQAVPPGQLPWTRALRTGKTIVGAGYLAAGPNSMTRALEASARPLPNGGATSVFRDITALRQGLARETAAQMREEVIRRFCRRLTAAAGPEDLSRIIADSALALLEGLPGAQVRLYTYEEETKQITRLASAPEEHPKRPRSQRQALPRTFPLDANDPLLWQVYVARQPFEGEASAILDEGRTAFCLAMPLTAGGGVLGHLSVVNQTGSAFEDTGLRQSLSLLASVAALALAGPRQSVQAAHLAKQVTALREVVGAVSARKDAGAMADLTRGHVRQVLGAEVCILATVSAGRLRIVGDNYKDDLLFPERFSPDDPANFAGTSEKAMRTGKTVSQTAQANPGLEDGLWRAFAGQSGRHSALSAPLPGGQGALTTLRSGEAPFTEEQVRFLETLAALIGASLPAAIPPASRTDL